MKKPTQHDHSQSAISSKAELLQRLRDRSRPNTRAQLSPGGLDAQHIRQDVDRENERRIARLRNALSTAHDALEVQHSFARLDGFAAAQFTKER